MELITNTLCQLEISGFLLNTPQRVKVYNDIDGTSYEILYDSYEIITEGGKKSIMSKSIFYDDISKRILEDIIRISKQDQIRSTGLDFDSAYFETEDNFETIRVRNTTTKPSNVHLCKCYTICITI